MDGHVGVGGSVGRGPGEKRCNIVWHSLNPVLGTLGTLGNSNLSSPGIERPTCPPA